MLLREMFSPIGAPKESESDINWIDDLKFFIDNDDSMLNQHMFPAVRKHKEYVGHPKAYALYLKPLEECLLEYCDKFEVDDQEQKFPKEQLIELAKKIAEEQERHIKRGDYED